MGRRRDGGDRDHRARGASALSALDADLELAERVARAAGDLLLGRFREPARGVSGKSTRTDLVSDADRDAETLIAGMLAEERPEDGILAEEGAESEASSGRRWVVDPLDGTVNFLYGQPAWAVSVALEDAEGPVVGVVLDPVRDELFSGVRGQGARLGGTELSIGQEPGPALGVSLVATGFAYDSEERARQAEVLMRVLPRVRDIRRAGAAALDLCSLAAGRVEGYYERGGQPWDWAAGSLIVREAGGVVRDLDGEPAGLMASVPSIADELYSLVS